MSKDAICNVLVLSVAVFTLSPTVHAKQDVPASEELFDALYAVTFVDADNGWAVGRTSVILHTADGGATWTVQHRSAGTEERELKGVAFLDLKRGVAVGKKGLLLTTRDGGESWVPVARFRSPMRSRIEAQMLAEKAEFEAWRERADAACEQVRSATVQDAPGAPTGDGGREAKPVREEGTGAPPKSAKRSDGPPAEDQSAVATAPPAAPEECVSLARRIAEFDVRQAAWMEAWEEAPEMLPAAAVESLDFDSVQSLGHDSFMVSGEGVLLFSDDAGATWTPARNNPEPARFFWFANRQVGWVVGYGGYVGKTTDGGKTWTDRSVPEQWTLGAVFFSDDLRGWVGGEAGSIFSTSDGGMSWKRLTTGSQQLVYDLQFIDWKVGFAATWDGVLFTRDGGTSWHPIPIPEDLMPSDPSEHPDTLGVEVVHESRAYLVGSYGIVMRTDDGGDTWQGLRGAAKWDRDFRESEGTIAKRLWGMDAELGFVQPAGRIHDRFGPGAAVNFCVFARRGRFKFGGGFFMGLVSFREKIVAPADATASGEAKELDGSGLYFQAPVLTQFVLYEKRLFVLQGLIGIGFVYHGFSLSDPSAEKVDDEDGYSRDRAGFGSVQAISFGWYGKSNERTRVGPRLFRAGFYFRVGIQESWTWNIAGVQADLGKEDNREFGTELWPFIGLGGGLYQ